MNATIKRSKPVLIVGIIGWLFAPLLLYILWFKADSLIQGTSNYPLWFIIADGVRMAAYIVSIGGFWWQRRWSIDLFIVSTIAISVAYIVLGIFSPREFVLPLILCAVGLWFRPRLKN